MAAVTLGDSQTHVWCEACQGLTAVRVPIHLVRAGGEPVAFVVVCASCGTRYMPSAPVVTIEHRRAGWPRPWERFLWWLYQRECAASQVSPVGCAVYGCRKPGWYDCAWFQAVDGGQVRWVFCGARHRARWLRERGHPL